MVDQGAELYDAIYSRVKDYRNESALVAEWIRSSAPNAKTILNVACGTGGHDQFLKDAFSVDGLDLNPIYLEAARRKNPRGRYHVADMIEFDLEAKYDAIICLFSSIGYVRTLENLQRTLRSFTRHLKNDGVLIVEPWFAPENWHPGIPHLKTVDEEGFKLARMNVSATTVEGASSFVFHYLVGTAQGVSHFTEEHVLGLFSIEETKAAFAQAGLRVEHDPVGIFGRGLYVGRFV